MKDKLSMEDVLERGKDSLEYSQETSESVGVQAEAVQALVALGYGSTEALRAVKNVIADGMTVEEVLKLSLKQMMF